MIHILIIILLIIIIIIVYILNIRQKPIKLTNFKINNNIKILIIGSVHGNEPAGTLSCYELINFLSRNGIKNGNLDIFTMPNKHGYENNSRYQDNLLYPDINRNYIDNGMCKVSKLIINHILNFNKNDIIIDLHEAKDFHRKNNKSLGSSILPVNYFTKNLAYHMINKINKNIHDNNKKFTLLSKRKSKIGTLRDWCKNNNKNYILIELTKKQNLKIRVEQNIILILEVLRLLNVI